MKIKLFPYTIVRYAGMPTSLLESWNLPQVHLYTTGENQLLLQQQQQEIICDGLYNLVMQQTDDKIRQKIISLKRNIYNGKLPDDALLALLTPLLGADLLAAISEYISSKKNHERRNSQLEATYEATLLEQRRSIHALLTISGIDKGIVLSSPVLFRQLSSFSSKDPGGYKNAENKIEFSLLRYLTRTCYKTSPFSTFTHTRLGTFEPVPEHSLAATAGQVKINNSLFRYLTSILTLHPVLNELMMVSRNITVEEDDDKLRFMVNYLNVEAFQSIPASPVNTLIIQLFDEGPLLFSTLINQLAEAIAPAPRSDAKAYLLKMISTGMLEIGTGISGMEAAWPEKLRAFIHPHITVINSANSIYQALASLEKYKNNLPHASASERAEILANAENMINDLFQSLQQEAGLPVTGAPAPSGDKELKTMQFAPHHFKGNELFYEDCYNLSTEIIQQAPLQQITESVDTLLEHIQPLDHLYEERQRMFRHFQSHFKQDEKVTVTRFYKSYYQEIKQQATTNGDEYESNTWRSQLEKQLEALTDQPSEVITLSQNTFPAITHKAATQSRGMFVQLQPSDNDTCGVINAILPGMGKVNGRFLSLFDQEVTRTFLDYNNTLHEGIKVMELNDASGFNANIHPPLLSYEIKMPGGNNIYQPDAHIPLNELYIMAGNDQLLLYHNEQQVYAYDLSLESFRNRSRLYQLLAHFNPDIRPSLSALVKIVDQQYEKKHPCSDAPVYIWPRIAFGNQVVLRRKTWEVTTAAFPVIGQNEKNAAYFTRLNKWREQHRIPEQVFLFLRRRGNNKAKGKAGGLADDYKPQFISFHQPILITMLKKLLSRAGTHIWLEEALPAPSGQVKEYLIQWYKK
jgi:hypothetical protein